jgi:hypothetical protein
MNMTLTENYLQTASTTGSLNEEERTHLVTALHVLLAQPHTSRGVSAACLRGHIPETKLLRMVKQLEALHVISASDAQMKRTVNISRVQAILNQYEEQKVGEEQTSIEYCHEHIEGGEVLEENDTPPPLPRLSKDLRSTLLFVLEQGRQRQQLSTTLLQKHLQCAYSKAAKLMSILIGQYILDPQDATTRLHPVNSKRVIEVLTHYSVDIPAEPQQKKTRRTRHTSKTTETTESSLSPEAPSEKPKRTRRTSKATEATQDVS